MRTLCRCGASFMRSGIRNHQRRSDDPRCKETGTLHFPTDEPKDSDDQHSEDRMEEDLPYIGIDDTNGMEDFEVDPRGDFFCDYEDYSPEEFGLGADEGGYEDIPAHHGDSDDDEEVDETFLEPIRLPNPSTTNSNDTEASSGATQGANRLRGGAEVELKNKPYTTKFNKGKAGAVYTNHDCVDGNTSYTSQIGDPENPFSPFSSKIEWEIVHWAKTQGPSSTAFMELMSIEGVRGIAEILYTPDSKLNSQPRCT